MATAASNQSPPTNPLEGDDKPQPKGSEIVKTAEQDSTDESLTKLISANIPPMRQDQVQNAVKFLSHPKVRGSPVIYRRSFLEKKGLTREEIDEAFRQVPDPSPGASSVDASAPQASVQQNPPASMQSQAPVVATSPAPVNSVSAASTMQQYKFKWSHALLAIGVLAASGAGSAVIFKNSILPRLKDWIRRVVKEKDDAEEKDKPKANPSEEMVESAKQAAAAAAMLAKTSQDLLLAKSEDKKYFEALKGLLDVQVEELKSMGKAIRDLESKKEVKSLHERQIQEHNTYAAGNGTINSSQRISYGERSEPISSAPQKVNGSLDRDSATGRPSSAPASVVDPSGAPYSKSYMEIMAMIQRGETPPGIKEINDMPPNPNQPLSNPRVAPRTKPWELVQQEEQSSSYSNGTPFETSEPLWDRKSVKITEIEPEKEGGRPPPPSGIGSSEWRGRGWVPPQPPSVAIPEAAIAIRQPKSSAQKQQVVKEVSVAQHHLGEDEVVKTAASGEEAGGSSSSNVAGPGNSEIQEEPVDGIQA